MVFSEANQEWQAIPQWAEFMIRFGYNWPGGGSGQRRVALMSMPCDSSAAGLIALGALVRDLETPKTNDVDGYFESLLRYASQYLRSCRKCNAPCDPELNRCGHLSEATGRVKYTVNSRGYWWISENSKLNERILVFERRNRNQLTVTIDRPEHAMEWQIDNQPPPVLIGQQGSLPQEFYNELLSGAQIISENLGKSFSGLCFAGRIAGETKTREMCSSIRFRSSNEEYSLPDLLTVHGWTQFNISRMAFFNSRVEELDRYASTSSLVIADGDVSFLRILNRPEFRMSDVVGVIHRTMERDKLEAVGEQRNALRQWYSEDLEMLNLLHPIPRGIGVLILKRRSS